MTGMPVQERVVTVGTPSRTYDVHVGCGILEQVGPLVRAACTGEVACVISDSTVAPLYADRVRASLASAGWKTALLTFPAGEASKRIATYGELLEGLAAAGLTRDDCIVALGGGVTGDMAGFAAATYLRGCQVAQVPTSLLAMVDSSVGGKTAVDLKAGKNLAGAFFQPSVVVADVDCLDTIGHDLITDSCGEVIKHAVLSDPALFDELARTPLNGGNLTRDALVRIVARNVEIKRDVVDADEREQGLRQTLNLGHTIGHAIEAASDYHLGHGSSVAAGMCCMARGLARLGEVDEDVARRITTIVGRYGLPTDTAVDHSVLLRLAHSDKKRHGDSINIVVPHAIGSVSVEKVSCERLASIIDAGCGTKEH